MNTSEVALNTSGLNASEIAVKGNTVYTNLNGNTNFTSCVPYLPILLGEVAVLEGAITIAKDEGTKAETSAERAATKKVKRTLKVIAALVNYEANGDETKLLTSGFDLKVITPPSPKTFNAKQGKVSGTVDLEVKSARNSAYMWEMSTDPIGAWTQIEVTVKSKTTVVGLTPGTKYWFRVALITGSGKNNYSDPHFVMVV